MKIAIVGCGALGSYYGARLCAAGHETHFLLRSDFEAVRRSGVQVHSPDGGFLVRPHCASTPSEIGPADLVIVALKATANGRFEELLPPLTCRDTAVLTLQNGLGNEEALARLFPPVQILGGLCFVCLNRTAPGQIHHLAHGRIVLGEFGRPSLARTHEIAGAIRDAGVPCDVTENLARAHWEKLVWNIPFNGLGVASAASLPALLNGPDTGISAVPIGPCLTTDRLLGDPGWHRLVRELMAEVVTTAAALGHSLPVEIIEHQLARTREMGAYRASTLIDFERRQPIELDALFREPLRQARTAGVDTPRLRSLVRMLEALSGRNAQQSR